MYSFLLEILNRTHLLYVQMRTHCGPTSKKTCHVAKAFPHVAKQYLWLCQGQDTGSDISSYSGELCMEVIFKKAKQSKGLE